MTALVTLSDLAGYKYINDSVRNSAIFPQFVSEAQLFDVKPWLGDALLNEIVTQYEASPSAITTLNETLLSGGSYVYQTNTYLFQGLRSCIMYYAFSRFTSRTPYNYTQAGLTVKDSDLSTPASDKVIQRLTTEALLTAAAIRDEVVVYLRRNSSSYPLFNCSSGAIRPRTFYVMGE